MTTGMIPRRAGIEESLAMLTGADWMTDDRLLHQGLKIHACGATWARCGTEGVQNGAN
jgi:hypothetical protein